MTGRDALAVLSAAAAPARLIYEFSLVTFNPVRSASTGNRGVQNAQPELSRCNHSGCRVSGGVVFHVVRPGDQRPAGGTVVLDTTSAWRVFHVLKSPVVQADGALKAIPHYDEGAKLSYADTPRRPFRNIIAPETAAAPANWKDPNFDDSDWPRGTAVRAIRSPYLERLCLRGKFTVTDPAKVKGLSVSVDYHGGAVVYVNGQEIGRQNLAAGGGDGRGVPPRRLRRPRRQAHFRAGRRGPPAGQDARRRAQADPGPRAEAHRRRPARRRCGRASTWWPSSWSARRTTRSWTSRWRTSTGHGTRRPGT